jgi:putative endonuclease
VADEAYAYIVRCADGTYYTGWTNNLDRRLRMHNSGRGAAYTRARRPVRLVYAERHPSRSAAMRRENSIKRLSRQGKARLISTGRRAAPDEAKGG